MLRSQDNDQNKVRRHDLSENQAKTTIYKLVATPALLRDIPCMTAAVS